ncbi:MAG: 50S ribosomal protein L25/general stress protein Ctc [Burkholderiales bacterium]|nr:50S ribosomal protein L25/general stress protein Ctc [Burkholderiales bacterium]
MKFSAETRNDKGTGASRRLRHAGKLPGIVYGGKVSATPISLDQNETYHNLRKEKFHASILDMELDGKLEKVLLRDFQMHPYKPIVLHIDFQRIAADQPITMDIPLHFEGEEKCPAVVIDKANVTHTLTELEVECLPADLPEFILVDLSGLTLQEPLHVSDLKLPSGVKAVLKPGEDPTVATADIIEEEVISEEAPVAPGEVPAIEEKSEEEPTTPESSE